MTAFVVVFVLFAVLLAATLSLGFYVDNLDTIFPNVWADGIDLSGMTLDEASRALIRAGYESNAEGVSATIIFSDGEQFTIYGDDAGFALNAEEAARVAFEYGRGGSFLEKELAYLRSLYNRTDLREVSMAKFNEQFVRSVVSESTRRFNNSLIDDAYDINSDSIVIIKGAGVEPAVEDDVYELTVQTLHRAMDQQTHLIADFITRPADNDDVDLDLLYDRISITPVSAVYDRQTFGATESVAGVSFDMAVAQAKLDAAGIGDEIVIPLIIIEPEVTTADIESMLFRDTLATRTTRIAGTANRLTNITVASNYVDETVLNPGEQFSFNAVVGRRTIERGFRMAGAFVSGRLVEQVGGGICQVTSTIYDTVLHADLEVIERRPHGMIVTYLPLGNDATIAYGNIDFRFRNSSEYPIRIESNVEGRELTVSLIGTKLDDNYIKIDTRIISSTPIQVIMEEDESVPPGETIVETEGITGYVVDTYKLFYDAEDNLIEEVRVGRSTYSVQNRLILIPIEEETHEPLFPPEPTDPPTTEPPTTEPPATEPPPTDPPTTEPPTTEPPPTDPPEDSAHEPPDDSTHEPPADLPDDPPDGASSA